MITILFLLNLLDLEEQTKYRNRKKKRKKKEGGRKKTGS